MPHSLSTFYVLKGDYGAFFRLPFLSSVKKKIVGGSKTNTGLVPWSGTTFNKV